MLNSFWEGLGNKLAERWTVLLPAIAFWAGGLIGWFPGHGGVSRLEQLERALAAHSVAVLVAVAAAAVLLVVLSTAVVRAVTLPVLRLLEGYWPSWLAPLRRRLIQQQARAVDTAERRFSELAAKLDADTASPEERGEYVALDRQLRRVPSEPDRSVPQRRMPTRLGNTLRAAETWPVDKYGLDPVKCWPRLWLLLPESVRQELVDARAGLDAAGAAVLWGVLFVGWTVWAWWAAPVGLLTALAAYRQVVRAAEVYGDLVESAFDLHRSALYESLRWPLPHNPAEEHQAGRALTDYLWRGSDKPSPEFTEPENHSPNIH
jgi:hypothetical protein